jgi:hypothetical protein
MEVGVGLEVVIGLSYRPKSLRHKSDDGSPSGIQTVLQTSNLFFC